MLKQNDLELELIDDLNMAGGTVLSTHFIGWLDLHTLCPGIVLPHLWLIFLLKKSKKYKKNIEWEVEFVKIMKIFEKLETLKS